MGQPIHGFAGGAFGRDSYTCRRVEAVGWDWIVTRNSLGEAEFVSGSRIPSDKHTRPGEYCDCNE